MILPTTLEAFTAGVLNVQLFNTCEELRHNPQYGNFFSWPAATGYHHAYEGGLLAHTLEVAGYALNIARTFEGTVDLDVLITAALWHDVAKIWDYEVTQYDPLEQWLGKNPKSHGLKRYPFDNTNGDHWNVGEYYNKVHHIQGSAIEFAAVAAKHGVPRETRDKVVHAILAHHGPVREWGSPVKPQTLEALILHQADMLSAGYGATKNKTV